MCCTSPPSHLQQEFRRHGKATVPSCKNVTSTLLHCIKMTENYHYPQSIAYTLYKTNSSANAPNLIMPPTNAFSNNCKHHVATSVTLCSAASNLKIPHWKITISQAKQGGIISARLASTNMLSTCNLTKMLPCEKSHKVCHSVINFFQANNLHTTCFYRYCFSPFGINLWLSKLTFLMWRCLCHRYLLQTFISESTNINTASWSTFNDLE